MSSTVPFFISFWTVIWLYCELVSGQSPCAPAGPGNIVVDVNGGGQFNSLGAAIQSIPDHNNQWRKILLKPGLYWEKVFIPASKPCISIQGSGITSTKIVFNASEDTLKSVTFHVDAEYVIAKYMSFENNYSESGTIRQAVAALVNADKIAFYECGFSGWQDTLWDSSGRHYYKRCIIYGAVDFIWGGGQSIFEKIGIHIKDDPQNRSVGWLTAQGRNTPQDTSGFVFKYGRVYGTGYTYLGRAYGAYSRVLFYKFNFDTHVVPAGWDAWNHGHHVDQLTYSEKGCWGQGADLSKRVKWVKNLTDKDWSQFLNLDYINHDKWIQQLPNAQVMLS